MDARDIRIAELERQIAERDQASAELLKQVGALTARVKELEAQLSQNSGNSHRPPSSDGPGNPVKPRPPNAPTGRRPGGQPGHKGKTRQMLPPERVDAIVPVRPSDCEGCGASLSADAVETGTMLHQVTEIPPIVPFTTEYRLATCLCPKCGQLTTANLPHGVPHGAFGPRLQAMIAMMVGQLRLSRRVVHAACKDLFGLDISVGSIQATCERVSSAVAPEVASLAAQIASAPVVHADETGWRQRGERRWLWAATAPHAELFIVASNRGRDALHDLLPEDFHGVVHSDRWRPYERFEATARQLCHAHLRRDAQALIDRGGEAQPIGQALLAESDRMFHIWHEFQRDEIDAAQMARKLVPVRARWAKISKAAKNSGDRKARALGTDLLRLWDALWTFVYVDGVEPTNNDAERALRHAVIWRKTTFGNASDAGAAFTGRILSVIGTAKRRGVGVLGWLHEACLAALSQVAPPPIALPSG